MPSPYDRIPEDVLKDAADDAAERYATFKKQEED